MRENEDIMLLRDVGSKNSQESNINTRIPIIYVRVNEDIA